MNLERFTECSLAYGAARRRWPEGDRPLFDRLASTPEGAAVLADAERTDLLLDAWALGDTAQPGKPLQSHHLRHQRFARELTAIATPTWWKFARHSAAFAASGLLGCWVGFVQVNAHNHAQHVQQLAVDAQAAAQLLLGPSSLKELGL